VFSPVDCEKNSLKQFKQKMQLIPTNRHLLEILDAAKVADMILFVLSAEEEVDKFGELCMTTLRSQGIPSTLSFVQVCVDSSFIFWYLILHID
jgi:pre-rRNA-processing protein TSR1